MTHIQLAIRYLLSILIINLYLTKYIPVVNIILAVISIAHSTV